MPTLQSLFDLTGRCALITGGTGYLGRALAEALAEAGASVVIASRSRERAIEAAKTIPTNSQTHHGVQLDHKDDESLERGFAEATDLTGSLDILVNNGQAGTADDLTEIDRHGFENHCANASGYFLLARALRDDAVSRGKPASVIMIGSMYGMVGSYPDAYKDICSASSVGYHTQKGGILQMTRHLAVYWANDDVRVNALSPGPFPPDTVDARLHERLSAKSPMGRMGKPHELKGALLLLASDAGSYITGQNLIVDGGWTAW
ncbi:MAG: SDR family oxidoreductase [Verrucomicrobiota bacterium]